MVLGSVIVITDISLFRYPDVLDAKKIIFIKWVATLVGIVVWLILTSLANYDFEEQLRLSIPLTILFFFVIEALYCYPKLTRRR